MANYAVTNSTFEGGVAQQAITANTSQGATISITASSTSGPLRRGKVYDVLVGTAGTPADAYVEWSIARITTNSTATAFVATPLDPADGTALSVVTINSTTMGTVTAGSELWYVGVNQRASYRWVAAPGSELVWPATSSNGLVLRAKGSATVTPTGTILFQEQ